MNDFIILHTMDDTRIVVNLNHVKYFKTTTCTYPIDPKDYSIGFTRIDNTTLYMDDGKELQVKEATTIIVGFMRGDHCYEEMER